MYLEAEDFGIILIIFLIGIGLGLSIGIAVNHCNEVQELEQVRINNTMAMKQLISENNIIIDKLGIQICDEHRLNYIGIEFSKSGVPMIHCESNHETLIASNHNYVRID